MSPRSPSGSRFTPGAARISNAISVGGVLYQHHRLEIKINLPDPSVPRAKKARPRAFCQESGVLIESAAAGTKGFDLGPGESGPGVPGGQHDPSSHLFEALRRSCRDPGRAGHRGRRSGRREDGKARPPRPPLDRDHGKAIGRHGRGDDVSEGRQRRRRRVRDARRRLHDVRRPELGRRDPGLDLQSEDREGRRTQRPGCRPVRRDPGILQVERVEISTGRRGARRRDARNARGIARHAGRVRHPEPAGRPGAGHPDGPGLSHGPGDGRPHRKG